MSVYFVERLKGLCFFTLNEEEKLEISVIQFGSMMDFIWKINVQVVDFFLGGGA